MASIVLVHGAWHGAWCWDRVAGRLAAAGHAVSAPTLSGLGERRSVVARHVGLETHVDDVVDHLWFGDLADVVLVAHSYGGMVAGGVVARVPERIARLVLVDAFLPASGEGMTDHIGDDAQAYRAAYEADADWRIPAPPLEVLGVTDAADLAWAGPRITPQPVRTFLDPLGEVDFGGVRDRVYVACTAPAAPALEPSRARARAGGWSVVELAAGHDAMISAPEELTSIVVAA
jgi:pimeloyl-ACP methyl ester carboxylesterase